MIVDDSTEAVIQRMIEGMRSFIMEDKNGNSISGSGSSSNSNSNNSTISPVLSALFHLKIKTLQSAPREPAKLEQIIKTKEKQQKNEDNKARHIVDIQKLVTEIDMLKFVLFLVNRNNKKRVSRVASLFLPFIFRCLSLPYSFL
jgi:hypothetical protein